MSQRTRHTHRANFAAGVALLALPFTAQAYITVGPSGTYATIQQGVDAAILAGGDEVRVQHKCFTFCPYDENVVIDTPASITLSGGWAADFQSRIPGVVTPIRATGANAAVVLFVAHGTAIDSLRYFALVGLGNGSAQSLTRGLAAEADDSASLIVSDNIIEDHQLAVGSTSVFSGGAGIAAYAFGNGYVSLAGNTIQSNIVLGPDTADVFGGGVGLSAHDSGRIDFVSNQVLSNEASNPNGGHCYGGGIDVESFNAANVQLRGNTYRDNALAFCTNGADGDAARIAALNTSAQTGVALYEETWDHNQLFADPGVYQVFVQARNASTVTGANGLVTRGIWGGLFISADPGAEATLSNFTVADNAAVGITASGSTVHIGNTLMWNDGTNVDPRDGAVFTDSFWLVDPVFVDAANGNYRLSAGSPAIDAGSASPPGGLRPFDLDGNPRPTGPGVDIGAYEYQPAITDIIFRDGFD